MLVPRGGCAALHNHSAALVQLSGLWVFVQRRSSKAMSCWFALQQLSSTTWLQVGDVLFALGAGLMATARTPGQLIAGGGSSEAIACYNHLCACHNLQVTLHLATLYELHAQQTCSKQMHHPLDAAIHKNRALVSSGFHSAELAQIGYHSLVRLPLGQMTWLSCCVSATARLRQAMWAPLR